MLHDLGSDDKHMFLTIILMVNSAHGDSCTCSLSVALTLGVVLVGLPEAWWVSSVPPASLASTYRTLWASRGIAGRCGNRRGLMMCQWPLVMQHDAAKNGRGWWGRVGMNRKNVNYQVSRAMWVIYRMNDSEFKQRSPNSNSSTNLKKCEWYWLDIPYIHPRKMGGVIFFLLVSSHDPIL